MQYTINGQFQFEGSNYRRKERKRGKHLLLHGDIFNQRDSIESSRAYGGVHLTAIYVVEKIMCCYGGVSSVPFRVGFH